MLVTTEDFQSLKGSNEFEFNPGINIIIGPNGSGKSSLFYAIENCLENPNGVDDCINFDSDSARVTIENNNESITWVREKGSSTYINNKTGDVKFKASKLTSLDLANLGFYFDKKSRIMNIHNEWSTLFPFGESDNDMFRLFEDIFNISCSFEILDNIKKDEQEVKAQIKQLVTNREQLQNKLNILNDIASSLNIVDIGNIICDMKRIIELKEVLEQDYKIYNNNHSFSNIVLPGTFDISSLYDIFYTVDSLTKDLKLYRQNSLKKDIAIEPLELDISFNEPKELRDDYNKYITTNESLVEYNIEFQKLEEDKKTVQDKISKIKVCPTCGHKLGE